MAFEAQLRLPAVPDLLALALGGFVDLNQRLLQLCPDIPALYASGVRYRRDAKLAAIPTILRRGWGDCKHLAPWRVAELRHAGERAHVRVCWTAPKMLHVYVVRADGSIEDPSVFLGMPPLPRSVYK